MAKEASKRQVVLQFNNEDSARLTTLLFARRESRPAGSRKLSVAQLFRDLLREATPSYKAGAQASDLENEIVSEIKGDS